MLKRTIQLIFIVFSFSLLVSVQAQGERQVWAFYMGFWVGPDSWNQQADVLTDYPSIGLYDSKNGGVVATQMQQARSAGIDAFVVSWFGLEDGWTTTAALNTMMDVAGSQGFRIGAVVDMFDPNYNRNKDQLIESLKWLVNGHATNPSYLRYNGKPVIMFAFQGRAGFNNAEWQDIRNQVDPNRSTLWIAEGINGCCLYGGAMDGMYAFNLAWANGNSGRYAAERGNVFAQGGTVYASTIHPGWDEDLIAARESRDNPTSPRERAEGQFLANSFQGAALAGSDIILVVSWNEFIENSHIEPSQLHGTQALDTLRPLVQQWKAGSVPTVQQPAAEEPAAVEEAAAAPPTPEPTGTVLIPWTNINVRDEPSFDSEVIGGIEAESVHAVIGEQDGWYEINLNGTQGFVWWEVIRLEER